MKKKIRVAIIGVGNCCSALVQGVKFYSNREDGSAAGFPFYHIGEYSPSDIEFVAAFDIDKRKTGKDLSQAIFSKPNNYLKITDIPPMGVEVKKGPVLDGAKGMLKNMIEISKESDSDVAEVLRNSGAEVVVNFLPAGADEASKFYAGESVKAECAFINATPSPIATNPSFSRKFEEAKLPVIGDDIMSQIGGTIFHKNILEFLSKRGVKILNTYQLDIGGGMETYNTLELSRRMLKRQIKTETIKSALPYEADIIAGTTDYVDFMENSRTSYFWIKGQYFLDTPVEIDIYLRTMDAPNSGTIIIDSIRAAKLALLRGVGGPLTSVCAYGYKSPPIRAKIDEAQKWFIEFLEGKRQR